MGSHGIFSSPVAIMLVSMSLLSACVMVGADHQIKRDGKCLSDEGKMTECHTSHHDQVWRGQDSRWNSLAGKCIGVEGNRLVFDRACKTNFHVQDGYFVLENYITTNFGCVTSHLEVKQCKGKTSSDCSGLCARGWDAHSVGLGDYQQTIDVGTGAHKCLTAVPPDGAGTAGSLSMGDCKEGDLTQVWLEPNSRKEMISKQDDGSDQGNVCVSKMQADEGVTALTYSHEYCLGGFRTPGDGGDYWLLDMEGKLYCVAAESTDKNFYLAECSGSTPDTCANVTVKGHEEKTCLNNWRHKDVPGSPLSVADSQDFLV